jgi:hypothetical protein
MLPSGQIGKRKILEAKFQPSSKKPFLQLKTSGITIYLGIA